MPFNRQPIHSFPLYLLGVRAERFIAVAGPWCAASWQRSIEGNAGSYSSSSKVRVT